MLRRPPSKLTAESFVIISRRVALTSCLSPTAGLGPRTYVSGLRQLHGLQDGKGCMCILPGVTRTRSDGPAPGDPHPCLVQGRARTQTWLIFLAKSGLAGMVHPRALQIFEHGRHISLLEAAKTCIRRKQWA